MDEWLMWVAGFIEGDGSFIYKKPYSGLRKSPHKGQMTYSVGPALEVQASQNTRWPLDKIQETLGVGKVHGLKVNSGRLSSNEYYVWRTSSTKDAMMVMEILYLYLSPRRQKQIDKAIGTYTQEKRDA